MKLLLLAGTAEARALAGLLATRGHQVTASLAGATRAPLDLGVETRIGGFGGAAGLRAWLRAQGIEVMIDATHPFARQMPHIAAEAAEQSGLPRLRLLRPAWPLEPGWREAADLAGAIACLPPGAQVLATTGRGETAPFAKRPDLTIYLRSIEDPGPLPDHVRAIRARPPFTIAEELALLRTHGITHLLAKNAGGARAKLEAATAANVQVILIRRPSPPPGPIAGSVDRAADWLDRLIPAPE